MHAPDYPWNALRKAQLHPAKAMEFENPIEVLNGQSQGIPIPNNYILADGNEIRDPAIIANTLGPGFTHVGRRIDERTHKVYDLVQTAYGDVYFASVEETMPPPSLGSTPAAPERMPFTQDAAASAVNPALPWDDPRPEVPQTAEELQTFDPWDFAQEPPNYTGNAPAGMVPDSRQSLPQSYVQAPYAQPNMAYAQPTVATPQPGPQDAAAQAYQQAWQAGFAAGFEAGRNG